MNYVENCTSDALLSNKLENGYWHKILESVCCYRVNYSCFNGHLMREKPCKLFSCLV